MLRFLRGTSRRAAHAACTPAPVAPGSRGGLSGSTVLAGGSGGQREAGAGAEAHRGPDLDADALRADHHRVERSGRAREFDPIAGSRATDVLERGRALAADPDAGVAQGRAAGRVAHQAPADLEIALRGQVQAVAPGAE